MMKYGGILSAEPRGTVSQREQSDRNITFRRKLTLDLLALLFINLKSKLNFRVEMVLEQKNPLYGPFFLLTSLV